MGSTETCWVQADQFRGNERRVASIVKHPMVYDNFVVAASMKERLNSITVRGETKQSCLVRHKNGNRPNEGVAQRRSERPK